MFEATRLLHFHPEVLHVGENHVLRCLAKMSESIREREKKRLEILQMLEA